MRKRFEQPTTLDAIPIPEVKIDMKSRDQFPKLLSGLLHIFMTPELNESIFAILEEKVLGGKKKTGRMGMSLWELFVLGTVRLNLNIDYDRLHDLSNNHQSLRGLMGVETTKVFEDGKYYELQNIKDNLKLLDEETMQKINEVIVKAGHKLKKKEAGQSSETIDLVLKSDTFVVESNIHFPTDLNLLWDSVRKCLDTIEWLSVHIMLSGWRKLKDWYRKMKKLYRACSNIHRKKGKNYATRLSAATTKYLKFARLLLAKVDLLLGDMTGGVSIIVEGLKISLLSYKGYLEKFIDLVDRRILQGEKIPHGDKIFSIFEPHVEWLTKGKEGKKVELGHNVLVTTDQYNFIVDHEVVIKQKDAALVLPLVKRLGKSYGGDHYNLKSISFDRGFYSGPVKKALQGYFEQVIMPKPGKKNHEEENEELQKSYEKLRKKHSAVESNINELEHSGADKVRDKGLDGFKNYMAWSVVAHNLKRLGRIVMEQGLLPQLRLG